MSERHGKRRVPLREAAVLLGMSEEAVTMRIRRGTLHSEKSDEQVHVWLDEDPHTDQNVVYPQAHIEGLPREKAEGIQELWEQVHHFRGILAEERHARHRTDTIIVHLTRANAALASRVSEFEDPSPPLRPDPAKPIELERTQSDRAEPERVQPEKEESEKPDPSLLPKVRRRVQSGRSQRSRSPFLMWEAIQYQWVKTGGMLAQMLEGRI